MQWGKHILMRICSTLTSFESCDACWLYACQPRPRKQCFYGTYGQSHMFSDHIIVRKQHLVDVLEASWSTFKYIQLLKVQDTQHGNWQEEQQKEPSVEQNDKGITDACCLNRAAHPNQGRDSRTGALNNWLSKRCNKFYQQHLSHVANQSEALPSQRKHLALKPSRICLHIFI